VAYLYPYFGVFGVCSVRPLYWLKCVTCSVFGFWVLLSGELLLPAFTIYGDFIRVLVSCLWLQLESTSWQKEVGEVAKTLQTHIYYISSIYIVCMSWLFWRSPNFWWTWFAYAFFWNAIAKSREKGDFVAHNSSWNRVNGNEIEITIMSAGIPLTHYAGISAA